MWLLLGIAIGAGLLLLVLWLRSRGINFKWYEYLLGFIGLVLLIFTLQNYEASIAELEPIAPTMFLLVFGIPGLVFLLITAFLVWFRWYRGKASSTAEMTQT